MVDYKALKTLSKQKRANNGSFAFIIFCIAGIFVAALSLFNLAIDSIWLYLILVPLIILPTLFSFHFLLLHIAEVPQFNLGIFFRGFGFYFKEHFKSSFRFTKTLLFSLLWYIIIGAISLLAINLPIYYSNAFGCGTFIDEFAKLLTNEVTQEMLDNFIHNNWYTYNMLGIVSSALPLSFVTFFVIYKFSRNSLSIYLRNDLQGYSGKYLKKMFNQYTKENRFELFKADMYLNWPSYLAFILTFVLGGYLGSLNELSLVSSYTFALLLSLFTYFTIFGAYRYSSKEAMYMYFQNDIKQFDIQYKTLLIKNFASLVSLEKNDKNKENNNEE